jgi:prepilin-type N-terminal cleavage/methylation domain-containing protein/prepilin-type processing-associated H-X9-DG protein
MHKLPRSCGCRAFTLLELMMVIAILALLAVLSVPEFSRFIERARSASCAANLKAIGIATSLYVGENNGTFPIIETNPADPVYPEEVEAKSLLETLGPYGLDPGNLRCPADTAGPNYFARFGTSYEWRPVIDGENSIAPVLYTRRGARTVSPKRVRIAMDYSPVHHGRMNFVFADGRVRRF